MLGCDHSTGGAIIGGSLKRAGLGGGVMRYACGGRASVNITAHEAADLRANGIPIGIVLEHEADWLLRGNIAARVQACVAVTRAAALPDGVVYHAADWDCTLGGPTSPGSPGERNMRGILGALQESAGVIGPKNVGFYGSKFGIDWLVVHAPWILWHWQTEAWSEGQRSPHACFFQRAQAMNVAGVEVDVNEIWKPAWGQRVHAPPPPPAFMGSGKARALVTFDLAKGTRTYQMLPGRVKWGIDSWAVWKTGFNRKTGQWRDHGEAENSPPFG